MTNDEINQLAKQAGALELPDTGFVSLWLRAFGPKELSEFVRLVREVPPKVINKFQMKDGRPVVRTERGWVLRTHDGEDLRNFNKFECEFIDQAILAASTSTNP